MYSSEFTPKLPPAANLSGNRSNPLLKFYCHQYTWLYFVLQMMWRTSLGYCFSQNNLGCISQKNLVINSILLLFNLLEYYQQHFIVNVLIHYVHKIMLCIYINVRVYIHGEIFNGWLWQQHVSIFERYDLAFFAKKIAQPSVFHASRCVFVWLTYHWRAEKCLSWASTRQHGRQEARCSRCRRSGLSIPSCNQARSTASGVLPS